MRKAIGMALLFSSVIACASVNTRLMPGAATVCLLYDQSVGEGPVRHPAEALGGCARLKQISIQEGEIRDSVATSRRGDRERAFIRLRNAAAAKGANVVHITGYSTRVWLDSADEGSEVRVSGIIYYCPDLVIHKDGKSTLKDLFCLNEWPSTKE